MINCASPILHKHYITLHYITYHYKKLSKQNTFSYKWNINFEKWVHKKDHIYTYRGRQIPYKMYFSDITT